MKNLFLSAIVACALLAAWVHESSAVTRYGVYWRSQPATRQHAQTTGQAYRRYVNRVYPKYIGGFHARHYQELGIPPGDIGLRGNGMYGTPW